MINNEWAVSVQYGAGVILMPNNRHIGLNCQGRVTTGFVYSMAVGAKI